MLKSLFKDTCSSVAFLSRFPVPARWLDREPDFAASAHTFPLAGMIIALPSALLLWGLGFTGLTPVIAALLVVATLIIVTGALHEDGLADTADGFWGGQTRERKLEIMRDSTIGTYGVLALTLSVALRVALYGQLLLQFGGLFAGLTLIAAAALSRNAMLFPWSKLPPARLAGAGTEANGKTKAGLSARFGAPDQKTLARGTVLSAPALIMLGVAAGGTNLMSALLIFTLATLLATRLSNQHIAGHTGDTLGATQQMSEMGLLLGLILTM